MVHAYFGRVAFYQVWLHNSFAVVEGGLQQAGKLLNYSGSLFKACHVFFHYRRKHNSELFLLCYAAYQIYWSLEDGA